MSQARTFHMEHLQFIPNGKMMSVILIIFLLGSMTAVAALMATLLTIVYLLNLVIDAAIELIQHLVLVYTQADSLGKILLLGILTYLLSTLMPRLYRHMRYTRQTTF